MIERIQAKEIQSVIGRHKAIIIMGARQVGKSTLMHALFDGKEDALWLDGDDMDVRQLFDNITSTRLKAIIGNHSYIIIDEAQRIPGIGLKMKLITDQMPNVQLVASGSSSFELASEINDSLTGRKRQFTLYPLMFNEMANKDGLLNEIRMIPHRMLYGYYPEVVTSLGEERTVLKELTSSYLYNLHYS